MTNGRWSTFPSVSKYFALAVLAVILSSIVLLMSPQHWFIPDLKPGSADWAARDCGYTERNAKEMSLLQPRCNFAGGGGSPIYLIGDSNAAHHSDGLLRASEQLGRPLFVLYSGSCPTLPVAMTSKVGVHRMDERDADERCLPWIDFILGELEQAPDGTVVFAISPTYWDRGYVDVVPAGSSSSLPQKAILEQALLQQVRVLETFGHDVALVTPMVWPQFECR